ncbi:hypothetical protein [Streptosporangium carneum]|uniref:hypothetical protein n=1 Tax=Streptosporangium carneum TaxID=47481 RepID=UPI0022F2CD3E|nr:hypothetical protein [Streptosporangium carneum]
MTASALCLALATACGNIASVGMVGAPATETPAGTSPGTPAGTPTATSTGTPTKAAVPAGFKRVGSDANGLTVAVPQKWLALDLTKDDLDQTLKQTGLSGEALEQARRSLRALVANRAIWASDQASAESSPNKFATNLNGFCQDDAGSPPPADQLIADVKGQLEQLGAKVNEAGEVPIDNGGKAVRVVYRLPSHGIEIRGTQYYVQSPGKTCIVTLSTDRDGQQALFDQIARTTQPT